MERTLEEVDNLKGQNNECRTAQPAWKDLFVFASRAHALTLSLAAALAVASGIVVPILAYLLGQIFNSFSSYGGGEIDLTQLDPEVSRYALYLAVLGGASWGLNGAFFSVWMMFGELQAKTAREKLYEGMMAKDMTWYETQNVGASAIVQRLHAQIQDLQLATSQPFGFVVQYATTMIVALVLAFWNSWDLTLVTLATVPVGAFVLAWISGRMQPAIEKQAESLTKATRDLRIAIEAVEVVKCSNAQNVESWRYSDAIRAASIHYLAQARANALQIGFVRLLTRTLFVQGFWYGSHIVQNGSRTSGQVLTAFWGCLMATQTFEQILPQMIVLEKGRAAGANLKDFLIPGVSQQYGAGHANTEAEQHCGGEIQLRHVFFAYPSQPDRYTLADVNLFFPSGQTVFVVGRSGSGKSTFGALLLHLYDTWEGCITLDGKAIESLNVEWLRKNLTVVQQESVLFNDSLLKNIALGRPGETRIKRSALDEAIDFSQLRSVIDKLPEGLSTVIGGGGTMLSGGQTQRAALARARLRDTPVLILDECTSALDRATATLVLEAIRSWRVGKTTIIITHDLSQVGVDDFVYVLDQGQVVQEGFRHALETVQDGPFVKLVGSTGHELLPPMTPSKHENLRRAPVRRSHKLRSDASTSNALPPETKQKSWTQEKPLPVTPPRAFLKLERSPSPHISNRASLLSNLPAMSMTMSQMTNSRLSMMPIYDPERIFNHPLSSPRLTRNQASQLNPSNGIKQYQQARASWIHRSETTEIEMRELPDTASATTALLGDKIKAAPPPLTLTQILATVWPRLRMKGRLNLVAGFGFAAVHATCTPVFSWIFAQLLATYYTPSNREQKALQWSLTLLGVTSIDAIASYLMHYLLEKCAQAWVDSIRLESVCRIFDQPKSWFESEEADVSQIIERLDRGAEETRNLLGRFAGLLFVAIVMTGIGLIWCVRTSWQLTLVGISTSPLMYGLTAGFDRFSSHWEGRSNRAGAVVTGIFAETYEKIKTIRTLTLERYFHGKYAAATIKAKHIGIKRATVSGIFFGISDASIIFVTALIFWYGSTLVTANLYPVSAILTVFSMLLFVISNVNAIVAFMPQLSSSRDTATSLLRLARLPSLDIHEHLGDTRLTSLPGPITVRNVIFSYPSRPGQRALNRLSFEIPLRKSTALVGASGSGKSTVVALLLRLYSLHSDTTNTGTVKVGNIPLAQLELSTWRSLVAYVPQQPRLFPGTIASNITYGLAAHSKFRKSSRIRHAAVHAGLDDFIMSLPQGYSTRIGEGGMGLSGGQTQKLAIARALVRRPRVLVLDEPTSALDATSAEEVRNLLGALVEADAVTVLVVTHNEEMIKSVDRVCVLEGGRCVEQGTFEELIARRGALRRLLGRDRPAG